MRKVLLVGGCMLTAALIAAGSFWGGMAYQSNQAEQTRANFMNARGLANGGQFPSDGQFANGGSVPNRGQFPGLGGGTTGQVKSIEGDVLSVSTAQEVKTVQLSADTQIEKTVSGAIGDLQPGMRVLVTGETGSDGVIAASRVQILSGNAPAPLATSEIEPAP